MLFGDMQLVCPRHSHKPCPVSFHASTDGVESSFFSTKCGIKFRRTWCVETTCLRMKNLREEGTYVFGKGLLPDEKKVMTGLRNEDSAWDLQKQTIFLKMFSIFDDFRVMVESILSNQSYSRLKYVRASNDEEYFVWIARAGFQNGAPQIYLIDVTFWIFSDYQNGNYTLFEELEYLKNLKEVHGTPASALHDVIRLAECMLEEDKMKEDAYNQICMWAKNSFSSLKRMRLS